MQLLAYQVAQTLKYAPALFRAICSLRVTRSLLKSVVVNWVMMEGDSAKQTQQTRPVYLAIQREDDISKAADTLISNYIWV